MLKKCHKKVIHSELYAVNYLSHMTIFNVLFCGHFTRDNHPASMSDSLRKFYGRTYEESIVGRAERATQYRIHRHDT